jgi:hypothetical protein
MTGRHDRVSPPLLGGACDAAIRTGGLGPLVRLK